MGSSSLKVTIQSKNNNKKWKIKCFCHRFFEKYFIGNSDFKDRIVIRSFNIFVLWIFGMGNLLHCSSQVTILMSNPHY